MKAPYPCPGQAKGIPKLTSSDFKSVGCIGIASPKGSVLYEVLASNTNKILKLEFRGKGVVVEAAASSTNNYRDTLQLSSNQRR